MFPSYILHTLYIYIHFCVFIDSSTMFLLTSNKQGQIFQL